LSLTSLRGNALRYFNYLPTRSRKRRPDLQFGRPLPIEAADIAGTFSPPGRPVDGSFRRYIANGICVRCGMAPELAPRHRNSLRTQTATTKERPPKRSEGPCDLRVHPPRSLRVSCHLKRVCKCPSRRSTRCPAYRMRQWASVFRHTCRIATCHGFQRPFYRAYLAFRVAAAGTVERPYHHSVVFGKSAKHRANKLAAPVVFRDGHPGPMQKIGLPTSTKV
jgi:hypothetical protein